jgi:coenzyme F420 biosynthesis associated uncharacterized protein
VIDWVLAEKLAGRVAGSSTAPAIRADLGALSRDSEARVVAYTGLEPQRPLPAAEGIERREWIHANVAGMRTLLDPVLDKAGANAGPLRPAVRIATGAVLTGEVGVILGFMAQRVLGQYELVLIEPAEARDPRLLFVLPNLAGAVQTLDVAEEEFLRWVALHEVTHAVQFAGVPWLQPHLAGLVKQLLSAMELRVDAAKALRLPGRDEVRRALDALRHGDVISLVARPEERATLDALQTAMAVVEGHAEHVMDAVGAEVLPSLPRLRAALERRRASQSAPARLIARLLGLEMKMRQYKMGKAFCDAVVAEGGIERLNRVWSAPDQLPTADELERPRDWLERTRVLSDVTHTD